MAPTTITPATAPAAPGPASAPATPAPRRAVLRRVVRGVVAAAFVGFIGWAVVRQWPRVSAVIGDLTATAIGLSAVAAVAGIWFSFLSWQAILRDFGIEVPVTAAMRIFFVSQAGKYIPGKVWPLLTQVKLGRDYQVPARTSLAATAIFMVILLGTGLLVALCTLPILGAGAFGRYWWALLVLPLAAVALWPPLLNRALARLMRLAGREPMPQSLSAGGIGRSVGWSVVMWVLYGVHLWALLSPLGIDAPNLLIRSIGAFAGSWAIGFLLFVAPAGVGPREVALVVLLTSSAAQAPAIIAAIVSRLLTTLGDLAYPPVALLLERRRRRADRRRTEERQSAGATVP